MYLDFDKIKEENPIEDVAQSLGLELKKKGNTYRCPCPSGQGGDRALLITPSKQVYYSFGLGKGGDVIALVALVKGMAMKDAAAWLVKDTQPEKKKPIKAEKKEKAAKPSEGFKPLEYLQHDHDAVSALGFDPEFAEATGLGYAPRGVMRGTIAIPVRSSKGKLLGYVGIKEAILPSHWHL